MMRYYLARKRRLCYLDELLVVFDVYLGGQVVNEIHRLLLCQLKRVGDLCGVYAQLEEVDTVGQHLSRKNNNGRGAITRLNVLCL